MKRSVLSILILACLAGCHSRNHFISNRTYRKKVEAAFEEQRKIASGRSARLLTIFDQNLTLQEKEAMEFLYAYMPLCDLADYDGEFYLKNVRTTFAARDTFSWGKRIPEAIFRHFVLPIRVNNENLDSARWVFFPELKDRLKHLSMKDAALEVNHWCHEKVAYKGSDPRTSSPLSTVKNAYGRCGEESTLTVAALRSVSIPARQCYTPRWAHCDDNHAWVEVWVDGKWHYMGACEPEPELDMAWFSAPAKRAMLVNTTVFGDYTGPEEVLIKTPHFTKINVLANYARTKRLVVKVTGVNSKPAERARVEFQLYNYAEFYPLHSCYTNKNGLCYFTTGLGDILVWGVNGKTFGFRKVSVGSEDTVQLDLSVSKIHTSEKYDFIPPPEIPVFTNVSDSIRKSNTERLEFEDRVRSNYESTFIDSSKARRVAANLKLNPDSLWKILSKSRGNWRTIIEFVSSVPPEDKMHIFTLLNGLSEKDLHDVTTEVLNDNVTNSKGFEPLTKDDDLIGKYVTCPRVDNELLKPYKAFFRSKFRKNFIDSVRINPDILGEWVKNNITTDDEANYSRTPLTPVGSFELKRADPHSKNILFIALCRSFGIPARLEPSAGTAQYLTKITWARYYFGNWPATTGISRLNIDYDPADGFVPEYYTNFTIEKINDGFFRSLDYERDPVVRKFPFTLNLERGEYMVVTGKRIGGGTVLANLSFIDLLFHDYKTFLLQLRKKPSFLSILGTIQTPDKYLSLIAGTKVDAGRGTVLAWLDPGKEPSRHFIAEIISGKKVLDDWKGNIILVFNSINDMNRFQEKNSAVIPSFVRCCIGSSGSLTEMSNLLKKKAVTQLPVVSFIDAKGNVIYYSEGYKIGTGTDILECINPEK